MSDLPRVAVVVPVHNRSEFLARCLSSLAGQDFAGEGWEVLVCDDGSTEDLGPVVAGFREQLPNLRHIRQQPAKGPAAARNMGFRSSKAKIFVCVDSDITCDPGFIRRLVEALESHPSWVAVQASVIPVGACESPLWDAPDNKGRSYPSGASAYRMDGLVRAGGFDETMIVYEDPELAGRLLRFGEFGYVAEAVAYHPRRRVTLRTHWLWRRHWKYVMILAQRHGFLAFPGKSAGRFPRLRVALAAVVTLPAGRFVEGMRYLRNNIGVGALACAYAIFDAFCGLCALPDILFAEVPPRRNYLAGKDQGSVP